MSTGADCRIYETKKNRWWYDLQQYPYGATEEYDTYGPFSSEEAAERHLSDNHANPGGYSVEPLEPGESEQPDPEGAIRPRARGRLWR